MSEQTVIHVCPNGCANATFTTTAHVTQDWEVDAEGEFLGTTDNCLQVDHGPDNGNIWTCSKCGADAEMLTCEKRKVIMPASASCLVARSGFLYTEIGTPPYTTPRAYFAEHGTVGLVQVPVYLDEHGAYSAIIDGVQIKT